MDDEENSANRMSKTVAFVGNPNVGKSAIINLLSSSQLKIGNWSGVTTEKIETLYHFENEIYHCIDLLGLYGFNNKSDEERITQQFVMSEKIDCLVNVVDSTALMNNLYCTLECRELQIPMIIILNFDDERIKNKINIDIEKLAQHLSIPIIQMSAYAQNKKELLKKLIQQQCQCHVIYHPLLDISSDRLFCDLCNMNHLDVKSGIMLFKQQYSDLVINNRMSTIRSLGKYITMQKEGTHKIDDFILHRFLAYPIALCIFGTACIISICY